MSSTKRPEVVMVTGASAGVGRATVRAFARQGAHIGLLARGRAAGDRRWAFRPLRRPLYAVDRGGAWLRPSRAPP